MAFTWTDKTNLLDDVEADHINEVAAGVLENQAKLGTMAEENKGDQTATTVPITDAGEYFDSATTEGALQTTGERTYFPMYNLTANGDFVLDTNEDGLADGLSGSNSGSYSLSEGVQSFMATSQNGAVIFNLYVISGHKYFGSLTVSADSPLVHFRISVNVPSVNVPHSGSGLFEMLSTVVLATGTGTTSFKPNDTRASAWTQVQIKRAIFVDLTATFGADNEPTADEMETLIEIVPSNWLDGSFNLTTKQISIWTLNLIRANTAAIAAL